MAEKGLQANEAATITHRASYILNYTETAVIEPQRVSMKRAACVVCRKVAEEERRGIRRQKRQPLQASTANSASGKSDEHVSRSITGYNSFKVSLCAKKGYWKAFHCSINRSVKSRGPD